MGESILGAIKKYCIVCSNSIKTKKKIPNASCLFEVFIHTHNAARKPRAEKAPDISFEKHILVDYLVLEKAQ